MFCISVICRNLYKSFLNSTNQDIFKNLVIFYILSDKLKESTIILIHLELISVKLLHK